MMTGPDPEDLAGGLHPVYGRHYSHAEAQGLKPRSVRYKAALLCVALDAVLDHYENTLDDDDLDALHDVVLQRLRPELRAEWSREDAVNRALAIAAEVRAQR